MPSFKIHKQIGSIFSFLFFIIFIFIIRKYLPFTGWKLLLLIPIIIVYSQLPDLDSYTSRIRRRILQSIFWFMLLSSFISLFIHVGVMITLLSITGFLGLHLLKVKHRGPLHTYWFVLIASLPMLLIHWFLFIIAFLCSSSHIFIDRLFSKVKQRTKKFFGWTGKTYVNIKL